MEMMIKYRYIQYHDFLIHRLQSDFVGCGFVGHVSEEKGGITQKCE